MSPIPYVACWVGTKGGTGGIGKVGTSILTSSLGLRCVREARASEVRSSK